MKVLIIDGTNLLHRSYYTAKKLDMTNQNGEATGVVFLTLKSIIKLKKDIGFIEGTDKLIFALDNIESKRYRKSIFNGYKSTRKSVKEEDFFKQIDYVNHILGFSNMDVFSQNGLEADDVCGILAKVLAPKEEVEKIFIFSSDKDYYQILNEKVEILRPQMGKELFKFYNFNNFLEEYENITTNQFIQLKAITGDDSDNIIGISKLGEGTGLKIIKKYGNLSTLLNSNEGYLNLPKWIREEIKIHLQLNPENKWKDYEIEYWDGKKISIEKLLQLNFQLAKLNYELKGLSEEEKQQFKIDISNIGKKIKDENGIQEWLNYLEIQNFTSEDL